MWNFSMTGSQFFLPIYRLNNALNCAHHNTLQGRDPVRIEDCTLYVCMHIASSEMWCWRSMEKISWTDRVRHEEVLQRVKEERNIPQTMKRRKATWICHILRRNCLLNHVTEWEIRLEVTGRRGRRRKQLQDDLKEKRGYWKLKQEALDRTLWLRICRKTDNRMNYLHTP